MQREVSDIAQDFITTLFGNDYRPSEFYSVVQALERDPELKVELYSRAKSEDSALGPVSRLEFGITAQCSRQTYPFADTNTRASYGHAVEYFRQLGERTGLSFYNINVGPSDRINTSLDAMVLVNESEKRSIKLTIHHRNTQFMESLQERAKEIARGTEGARELTEGPVKS